MKTLLNNLLAANHVLSLVVSIFWNFFMIIVGIVGILEIHRSSSLEHGHAIAGGLAILAAVIGFLGHRYLESSPSSPLQDSKN